LLVAAPEMNTSGPVPGLGADRNAPPTTATRVPPSEWCSTSAEVGEHVPAAGLGRERRLDPLPDRLARAAVVEDHLRQPVRLLEVVRADVEGAGGVVAVGLVVPRCQDKAFPSVDTGGMNGADPPAPHQEQREALTRAEAPVSPRPEGALRARSPGARARHGR